MVIFHSYVYKRLSEGMALSPFAEWKILINRWKIIAIIAIPYFQTKPSIKNGTLTNKLGGEACNVVNPITMSYHLRIIFHLRDDAESSYVPSDNLT